MDEVKDTKKIALCDLELVDEFEIVEPRSDTFTEYGFDVSSVRSCYQGQYVSASLQPYVSGEINLWIELSSSISTRNVMELVRVPNKDSDEVYLEGRSFSSVDQRICSTIWLRIYRMKGLNRESMFIDALQKAKLNQDNIKTELEELSSFCATGRFKNLDKITKEDGGIFLLKVATVAVTLKLREAEDACFTRIGFLCRADRTISTIAMFTNIVAVAGRKRLAKHLCDWYVLVVEHWCCEDPLRLISALHQSLGILRPPVVAVVFAAANVNNNPTDKTKKRPRDSESLDIADNMNIYSAFCFCGKTFCCSCSRFW